MSNKNLNKQQFPDSGNFVCENCNGVHPGEYHHDDRFSGARLYEVTCPKDGLVDYYNDHNRAL